METETAQGGGEDPGCGGIIDGDQRRTSGVGLELWSVIWMLSSHYPEYPNICSENGETRVRPRAVPSAESLAAHCFDRSVLVALLVTLALLGAFTLALLCYVLWDLISGG